MAMIAEPYYGTYTQMTCNLGLGGKDYVLEFRHYIKRQTIIAERLKLCKGLDEDTVEHIRKIEAAHLARLENPNLHVVEALQDKNELLEYHLLTQTIDAYKYSDSHMLLNEKDLIDMWREVCRGCYNDISVDACGLRNYDTPAQRRFKPEFEVKIADLSDAIAKMYNYFAEDNLTTAIVRLIYTMLMKPFDRSDDRLALINFTKDLGVRGLPIVQKFVEFESRYRTEVANLHWTMHGKVDITDMIDFWMAVIDSACTGYLNALEGLTKNEQLILEHMVPYRTINDSDFGRFCAMHGAMTSIVSDTLTDCGYVYKDLHDTYTRIR